MPQTGLPCSCAALLCANEVDSRLHYVCTHLRPARLPALQSFMLRAACYVLQYKFVVDGEWQCASDQPAVSDDRGNVNNVLEVQEYVPENLEGLSGFSAPASPPHR